MLSTWLSKRPVMRKKHCETLIPISVPLMSLTVGNMFPDRIIRSSKEKKKGIRNHVWMYVPGRACWCPWGLPPPWVQFCELGWTPSEPPTTRHCRPWMPQSRPPLPCNTQPKLTSLKWLTYLSLAATRVSLSLSLSRSKEEKSVKEKQQANLHTYERNSTIPPHLRRFCVCVFLLAPRLWLGEEERLDESAPSTLLIEYFIHIERMKSM